MRRPDPRRRRGFAVPPFARSDVLSDAVGADVWVKDETGNVGGSHKGRHLVTILLHLRAAEALRLAPTGPRRPPSPSPRAATPRSPPPRSPSGRSGRSRCSSDWAGEGRARSARRRSARRSPCASGAPTIRRATRRCCGSARRSREGHPVQRAGPGERPVPRRRAHDRLGARRRRRGPRPGRRAGRRGGVRRVHRLGARPRRPARRRAGRGVRPLARRGAGGRRSAGGRRRPTGAS